MIQFPTSAPAEAEAILKVPSFSAKTVELEQVIEESDLDGAKKNIIEICDSSLTRLKTDYIDVYQLHRDPSPKQMPVVMDTMQQLKKQGKIRFIGSSTNNTHSL